ncbi:unnamed protein product [Sympodiomycopsis kandeliae]
MLSYLSESIRTSFSSLDDESIPWKTIVLYLVLGVYAFETYLSIRQYRCYSYPSPPASLIKHVDHQTFTKSQAYGKDKAQFGFITGAWGLINSLVIIHFDVMALVWTWAGVLLQRAGRTPTEIPQSILFTLIFSLIRTVLDLPFSYYSHFVLEEKHGFNKMTLNTFVLDFVKGLGVGAVFMSPLIAGLIWIIRWAGTDGFVTWVLGFLLVFQVVAQILYPTVIQPLFNKLEPLKEGALKSRVVALASSLNFPLAKIYQIDGSKRSAHSNAYFFGVLPWANKHIVIFDTLIGKSTCSEIEAVLAHELGHWKHSDPLKLLVLAQLQIALTFSVFAGFIGNVSLFRSFGFNVSSYLPIIIGLELFQLVLSPTDAVLQFLMNSCVRSMEYSADEFAAGLSRPKFTDQHMTELESEAITTEKSEMSNDDKITLEKLQINEKYTTLLSKALIKLHIQNLSTMHHDALYSAYHHSHPTLAERLVALQKLEARGEKKAN